MIPLKRFAEPPDFDTKVRQRGAKFLSNIPVPTRQQWGSHSYWNDISGILYELYGGICSYCGVWISPKGNEQVDHFVPKSKKPLLAYEWTNFRLTSARVNNSKSNHEDVLDPFEIKNGWFVLDFKTLEVKPGNKVPDSRIAMVESSIRRLKLNDFNPSIKNRLMWLEPYINEEVTFSFLEKKAPFIAAELKRQKLVEKIKTRRLNVY